jgi:hypothetical protein
MGFRKIAAYSFVGLVLVNSNQVRAEENEYIGSGKSQFAPAISLSSEYRSNVYLSEGEAYGGAPTVSATSLIVIPKVTYKLDGSNLKLMTGANYNLRKFFNSEFSNLDRFRDAQVLFGMSLLPDAIVGMEIDERLTISSREAAATAQGSAYIQQVVNDVRSNLSISPGNVLDIDVGGFFQIYDYTGAISRDGVEPQSLNNKYSYGPWWNASWKFLPKTAFFTEGEIEWFNWQNNVVMAAATCAGLTDQQCYVGIPNGKSTRIEIGLNGQISEKLLMKISVGKGTSIYDESAIDGRNGEKIAQNASADVEGSDGLLFDTQLAWYMTSKQQISLQYERNFIDVYFTNYSKYDQMVLEHNIDVLNRWNLSTGLQYRIDEYNGAVSRTDHRYSTQFASNFKLYKLTSLLTAVSWKRLINAEGDYSLEYDDLSASVGLVFGY